MSEPDLIRNHIRTVLGRIPQPSAQSCEPREATPVQRPMSRRYNYEKMTPRQFSAALNQLNLTMRQFMRLSGASERKAKAWLAGETDIPPHVPVLCALLTLPGAMEMAKAVTDAMLVEDSEDA